MTPNTATLQALIDELSDAVKTDITKAENIIDKIRQNIPDIYEQIQISDDHLESLFSSLLRVVNAKTIEQPKKTSSASLKKASVDDF